MTEGTKFAGASVLVLWGSEESGLRGAVILCRNA